MDMLERLEACPVCGASSREPLYTHLSDRIFFCAPGEWTLHRCMACRSAYLDPRPTPQSIALAYRSYYTHAAPPQTAPRSRRGRWLRALRNGYLNARFGLRLTPASSLGARLLPLMPALSADFDRMVRHLPLPAGVPKLLDVGCGNGAFLALAQDSGWEAHGLEPDETSASVARAAGFAVEHGSLTETTTATRFEALAMSHVLEHLHDPEAALRKAYALLKPGGLLWVATPNLYADGHDVFARNWLHLDPPRHVVLFEADALKELLRRIGFECLPDPRPVRLADASYRASLAMARGDDPMRDLPELPFPLLLRRMAADLRIGWDARSAEELVVMARKPSEA